MLPTSMSMSAAVPLFANENWYTDAHKASDLSQLAGLDLAQVNAAAEELLCAHWPLVRALQKDLRRCRIVAEKDRRSQQAWAAALRRALGRLPDATTSGRETRPVGPVRQAWATWVAAGQRGAPLTPRRRFLAGR
jgi:hypothetical protein